MFTLITNMRSRESVLAEAPAFLLSLVIAETFYKFHSFTLECVCFLATWLAVSSIFVLGLRRLVLRRQPGAVRETPTL
jgi:hypothetical protein